MIAFIRKLFGPRERNRLQELLKISELIHKKEKENIGRMEISNSKRKDLLMISGIKYLGRTMSLRMCMDSAMASTDAEREQLWNESYEEQATSIRCDCDQLRIPF